MAVPLPVAQAPPVIERFRTFFPTSTTLHPKATCSRTNLARSLQPRKGNLRMNSVVCLSASTSSPGTTATEGIATSLKGVEVFDLSGKAIPILDLWKDRKAVVAFARHFGCVLCRKRADLLASKQDVMSSAGVALALIGPGTVEQARVFAEQTKFKGEIYADPNHSSYDALEFAYGVSKTFTPSAGLKIIQSYMEGYRQDWGLSFQKETTTRGGWYQGGVLVAGPGVTNILYIHKDREAGDDPDIEDVLRACCT
ncbi:thioredoxin-like protein AAED1 [Carex littledalei]|uniref:Thioredoxin-like protein AAED1 n=1 Tax=Carex littledalei TaxID=544730 RepID=A0A833R9W8_9POAL|nr:thioredoxin-like protein AAED1 [Carex littledalei]